MKRDRDSQNRTKKKFLTVGEPNIIIMIIIITVITIIIHSFYIALFSALEQTHCAHICKERERERALHPDPLHPGFKRQNIRQLNVLNRGSHNFCVHNTPLRVLKPANRNYNKIVCLLKTVNKNMVLFLIITVNKDMVLFLIITVNKDMVLFLIITVNMS